MTVNTCTRLSDRPSDFRSIFKEDVVQRDLDESWALEGTRRPARPTVNPLAQLSGPGLVPSQSLPPN